MNNINKFPIQIFGVIFSSTNMFGDFYYMSKQDEYSNSLFIFNDNEEHHNLCRRGAGNAIMRQFNKHSELEKPISAGIPTGTLKKGGYQELNHKNKITIDNAINEIVELINKHKYDSIYYSAKPNGSLGTSLFNVNQDVINYITYRIMQMSTMPVRIIKEISPREVDDFLSFDNSDNSDNV